MQDILTSLFPKDICTILIIYIDLCHDCGKYLMETNECKKCLRIRCSYCTYINSNKISCVECYDPDDSSTQNPCENGHHKICVKCNGIALYGGLGSDDIDVCYSHRIWKTEMYSYSQLCDYPNCPGTAIYRYGRKCMCSKHAKDHKITRRNIC